MAKMELVSDGERTVFALDDACLCGAVENLEISAEGFDTKVKLEIGNLNKLQVFNKKEYQRRKAEMSAAKLEFVSDGNRSICMIDGRGYAKGVESIDIKSKALEDCEVNIKICSVFSFHHHTPEEFHEIASKILTATDDKAE